MIVRRLTDRYIQTIMHDNLFASAEAIRMKTNMAVNNNESMIREMGWEHAGVRLCLNWLNMKGDK